MSRPRRKIIARVIVFLLLGTIMNVAVAWGCVKWSDTRPIDDAPIPLFADNAISAAERAWLTMNGWSPQPTHLQYGAYAVMPSEMPAIGLSRTAFFEFPDRANKGGGGSGNPYPIIADRTFAGWPLRSLSADSFSGSSIRVNAKVDYGFGLVDHENRILPTTPIWPGFAINTIFYAAILWLLFFAPGSVRRTVRRRRGLCPACAYPVGTSEVCTECGTTVRHQEN